ncbi:hypothetical protein FKP32DRAFT_84848 [Trametes sanguinea]|nr:hypothetical protein FKP32DRAFT_84848 [Trametes sanguinea]
MGVQEHRHLLYPLCVPGERSSPSTQRTLPTTVSAVNSRTCSPMPLHLHALSRPMWLKGRTRAARSSNVLSLGSNTQATQPQATTGRQSHRQELLGTSLDGLILVLGVTKTLSSACPHLPDAIDGLIQVLEMCKKSMDATKAVQSLKRYIEDLNTMLHNALLTGYDQCPPATKDRIRELTRAVESATTDVKKLLSEGWLLRLFNATQRAGQVDDCLKMLSREIQTLTFGSVIALEGAVAAVHADVKALGDDSPIVRHAVATRDLSPLNN